MYHSEQAAKNAEAEFDKIFIKKEIPDDIPELEFSTKEIGIADLLIQTELAPTKSEARRLIQQGGVSINGEKISDYNSIINLKSENIIKVGKRKFLKLIVK
jgi:tyrosyl-tRNA synthetase